MRLEVGKISISKLPYFLSFLSIGLQEYFGVAVEFFFLGIDCATPNFDSYASIRGRWLPKSH